MRCLPERGGGPRERGLAVRAASLVEEREIRVFLLDGDDVARKAIADHLSAEQGISVVGETGDVNRAMQEIPETRPNVVVLDLFLPGLSGVDLCREIRTRHPAIACLVITTVASEEILADALVAGATGFILKGAALETISGGLRAVAAGRGLVDPSFVGKLLEQLKVSR